MYDYMQRIVRDAKDFVSRIVSRKSRESVYACASQIVARTRYTINILRICHEPWSWMIHMDYRLLDRIADKYLLDVYKYKQLAEGSQTPGAFTLGSPRSTFREPAK